MFVITVRFRRLQSQNINFYLKCTVDQNFNNIKSRRPWLSISISHLFQQGLFSSELLPFTTGVLLVYTNITSVKYLNTEHRVRSFTENLPQ